MKKKNGFSLVEVIIVIAVIGVIALIAIPSFSSIQRKAKLKSDIITAGKIAEAAKLWVNEGGRNSYARELALTGTMVMLQDLVIERDGYERINTKNPNNYPVDVGIETYIGTDDYPSEKVDEHGYSSYSPGAFYVGLIDGKMCVYVRKFYEEGGNQNVGSNYIAEVFSSTITDQAAIYKTFMHKVDSKGTSPGFVYIEGIPELTDAKICEVLKSARYITEEFITNNSEWL